MPSLQARKQARVTRFSDEARRNWFLSVRVGEREFTRKPDGVWRYADSDVPVPGARDETLTDRFNPRFVGRADGEPEHVMLSGREVQNAPELQWALEEGMVLSATDSGEIEEVIVPYETWLERDRIPLGIVAPELHGDELERRVASAERDFRLAQRSLEQATSERIEAFRSAAAAGMTRREAAAAAGLTSGRIQQLIGADPAEPDLDEALGLVSVGAPVLARLKRGGPLNTDELANELDENASSLKLLLVQLVRHGLVTRGDRARSWAITARGRELLEERNHLVHRAEP